MNGPLIQAPAGANRRSKSPLLVPVSGGGKKRKQSGVPTGNAGEYFVMGELLRRGFDAQLADRNTKGYDLLAGCSEAKQLKKIQVKTVRTQPWYVRRSSFVGELVDQITIYVLLGTLDRNPPLRYFIARNRELIGQVSIPRTWKDNDTGFMSLKSLTPFEDQWNTLSS